MTGFDYDLDSPDEPDDLAEQLAAAKTARADAERRLAGLQAKHDAASPSAKGQQAAAGEPDLDDLLALVNDRSRSWPDVLADLEARGFRSSAPQPSRRGLRGA
jgi:hypothetical protein